MKFTFESKCILELEHEPGMIQSKHIQTKFNLEVSRNLDRKQYLDKDDLPTAAGTKALTHVFIQGLIGNIHHAHQKGYWNDAEHIRYIISELEKGFVQIATTDSSEF